MKIFNFRRGKEKSDFKLIAEDIVKQDDLSGKSGEKEQAIGAVEDKIDVQNENEFEAVKGNKESWWNKIGRWSIALLVFLLPFFFLPWTLWPVYFNKEVIAILLVSFSLICWLGKSINEGKIVIRKSFLIWAVWVFLGLLLIPAIFSIQKARSLMGGFILSDSFLVFLLAGLIFFLVSASFDKKNTKVIFYSAGLSLLITSILTAIRIFGRFIPKIGGLINFDFFGSVSGLGIYLTLGLIALLTAILVRRTNWWVKILVSAFSLLILVELIVINYWLGWLILSLSLIAEMSYLLSFQRENYHPFNFILVVIVLSISICFLIFRVSLPTQWVNLPVEVNPSWPLSVNIAQSVWHDGKLLTGTGLATFAHNYLLYRPSSIIKSQFWNLSFNQGSSLISTMLSTTGLVGELAWLFLIVAIVILNIYLIKKRSHLLFEVLVGSIIFLLVIFLHPADFVLLILFFTLAGVLGANFFEKKEISLVKRPQRAMLSFLVMLSVIVLILAGDYWVGRKYVASVYAQRGLRFSSERKINQSVNNLFRAINLDNQNDQYYLFLSQALQQKVVNLIDNQNSKKNKDNKSNNGNQIKTTMGQIINISKRATEIDSKNVSNWVNLGDSYYNLIGLADKADKFAVDAYQKAHQLDPLNPVIFVKIAKSYLAKSDFVQQKINLIAKQPAQKIKVNKEKVLKQLKDEYQKNLSSAQENFQQALKIKPDYLSASYLSAQTNIRQGKTEQAINKLVLIANQYPFDSGIFYQLGLLYYTKKDLVSAQSAFQRAVKLNPNFSNALYFLGLIYDHQGNKKMALQQFEKISKLNPKNQEIKKIVENLKAGRSALEASQINSSTSSAPMLKSQK